MKFKNAVEFAWDIAKIFVISLIIIIPIRYFIVQPFFVRGASMEPNYYQGDYLLVDEISYRFSNPERGDVIIFKFPGNPSQFFIKRIIGLPNETITIEEGEVIIENSQYSEGLSLDEPYLKATDTSGNLEIVLGEEDYFVLGDNRVASHDSRRWGPLADHFIIGRVFLRAWPFGRFELMNTPIY